MSVRREFELAGEQIWEFERLCAQDFSLREIRVMVTLGKGTNAAILIYLQQHIEAQSDACIRRQAETSCKRFRLLYDYHSLESSLVHSLYHLVSRNITFRQCLLGGML